MSTAEETNALKAVIQELRVFHDELRDLRDKAAAVSGLESSSYINKAMGQLQVAEVHAMSKLGHILSQEFMDD